MNATKTKTTTKQADDKQEAQRLELVEQCKKSIGKLNAYERASLPMANAAGEHLADAYKIADHQGKTCGRAKGKGWGATCEEIGVSPQYANKLIKIHQEWAKVERAMIKASKDGKRMTITDAYLIAADRPPTNRTVRPPITEKLVSTITKKLGLDMDKVLKLLSQLHITIKANKS